ncbi:uncharacterized protein CC84DRAFT_1163148 [Paraphaeosphaeria sporulosa]|uniref:TPR-like protein n=1 Tax=Paraphaeosphaeria sporulosa TaxID=1460663 RepID=A0A177CH01_9PLEO|nr:uncharacterized protein CC84DRAFT_1163148 [Paraphaeosphaeria sporulosa]OAG06844.1 hypothetical protein CC84DRAFT_1163148 [Paraphaeosphaeria sporulosa]
MPPKNRDFKAKAKSKPSNPQSEVEYLEAADEFEQAAGKWRAGDAAKSARFFQRAVQVYDEGLAKFPQSFDLAYNKAHLEYQACEDERVGPHLGNKITLLQETLASHRAAFLLNRDNLDVQFNTGQVLSSLAEALLEDEAEAEGKASARVLLEEAADLFANVLAAQQREYEQMALQWKNMQNEQGDASLDDGGVRLDVGTGTGKQMDADAASEGSSAAGEWATVEEALSPEVILETCTAQLGALTTLLGVYDSTELSNLEKRVQEGLSTVRSSISTLISLVDNAPRPLTEDEAAGPTLSISSPSAKTEHALTPKDDALLAAAIFQVAVADASYRSGNITAPQYASTVSHLFATLMLGPQSPEQQVAKQSAYADALVNVAEASSAAASDMETQWNALSEAQKTLTQLAKPPHNALLSPSRLADIFDTRADIDLTRFGLSFRDDAKTAWISSRNVLVSNAGVFYRGAKSYGERAGDVEQAKTAGAKAVVAEVLKQVLEQGGGAVAVKPGWKEQQGGVREVLEQMVNERILGQREGEEVLRIVSQEAWSRTTELNC